MHEERQSVHSETEYADRQIDWSFNNGHREQKEGEREQKQCGSKSDTRNN